MLFLCNEARADLAKLVDTAGEREPFVIAKAEKLMVKVTALLALRHYFVYRPFSLRRQWQKIRYLSCRPSNDQSRMQHERFAAR